jgi:rod shape-determining protein MreC
VVIKRLRNLLIVWLSLLTLLAIFSSLSQTGRDYFPVESSLANGVLPVFSFFNSIKKNLRSWWTGYFALVDTQKENGRLEKKLSQLEQENMRLREMASANERFRRLLELKNHLATPSLAAEVVSRSPTSFLKTLFINKGRKEGLNRGMPVVLPEGVVGRLEKTTSHFAQVILLNDPNFSVDCLNQRTRVRGILAGIPGEGNCQIKYVARTEDVQPGDIIITSGLDGLFPKGLVLGRVLKVNPRVKGNFLFIEVAPEVKLSRIEEVLVLEKSPPLPDQGESKDD